MKRRQMLQDAKKAAYITIIAEGCPAGYGNMYVYINGIRTEKYYDVSCGERLEWVNDIQCYIGDTLYIEVSRNGKTSFVGARVTMNGSSLTSVYINGNSTKGRSDSIIIKGDIIIYLDAE